MQLGQQQMASSVSKRRLKLLESKKSDKIVTLLLNFKTVIEKFFFFGTLGFNQ